ncbi:MAG: NAD(P)/FAD-dependent oxidoreductase [Acidobacteriota bacterium]|nr:MAG: NAD(P)/FAD-dependent oxidoreductase [Acidobacteriota bacterium]
MAKKYDAIIVGGGHNGLVAAAYLAKGGKKVLVLERRHLVGGCAVTDEIFPGFRYSVLAYVVSMMRPRIVRELKLEKYGYDIIPQTCSFTPLLNGDHIMLTEDDEQNYREISRFSKRDAEAFPKYQELLSDLAEFVHPILSMVPPDPTSRRPRDLLKFLDLGKRFWKLGKQSFSFAKLMSMSSLAFAEMFFESDVIKAQASCAGASGTFLGIRSPGTAYVLLHHFMGEVDEDVGVWGLPRGGMGTVSESIASSARSFGAEIRTEAPVSKILVKKGKAVGVVLEDGEEILSKTVASGVDPKLTFLKMVDPGDVPEEFLEDIRRINMRGCCGKVNLALDGLPDFTCMPGDGPHLRGSMMFAPSTEYLERAYDEAKYGWFSRRPMMEVVIPSLVDPSAAPPGKHVLSAAFMYASYDLKDSNWEEQREALGDAIVDTLCEHAPNIRDRIIHRQVITPWDLEQEFGLTEGNIFHGEITPDQLFMLRPVPGWAQYRMPVKNLYMCGSGVHPGGGIMGEPGRLAAQEMLKDWRSGALA